MLFYVPFENIVKEILLLMIVLVATVLEMGSVFNGVRFAIHQDFQYVSALGLLDALSRLLFYLSMTYLYGLKGIVCALLLNSLVKCAISSWISIRHYGRFGVKYDYRLIWSLMKVGFPLMMINFIFILMTSADRWVSISMLGKIATGYYGLGGTMVTMIVMLPYAINRVLFPKLNERMGATSDQATLLPLIISPVGHSALFFYSMSSCNGLPIHIQGAPPQL
jgi:O-antigen/teichoic acid export membrane protein